MSLTIKKAVIHVLDREASEPLLNEFELDINDDIYTFLEKHITRSAADDEARKAKFKEGRNIIQEVCFRMANDEEYFLEGSRDIARQLFKAMKTNSSISSTDLIVCLYEDESGSLIAILKMDYNTSFIHDIEMVEEKFKITIRKQEISLPGPTQKIQKCAFVRGSLEASDYELIVLDNQINSKNSEEPVAQFFLQTFLGAELIMDSKAYTKLFKQETETWIRNKAKEGESFAESLRGHVNSAIRQEEEIDLESFSREAFEDRQYLHEDYVQSMKEKGFTEEKFQVDREWVDKKLNRIKLKTETGIEIVMEYETYSDRERFEIVTNADGTRTLLIKNVTSIHEK
ncbi:MAG: nucleoid-associated protein [Clostridia bacterium]|nr:nucleoid-associated protein [Clostridia bacterium]